MGLIISRFRRKKTTTEVLETLETKIKRIEQDSQSKEMSHKRVIGHVMAYSMGIYVLIAVLYYYMYVGRSQHWLHSMMYASPLLILPVLVIFLRSSVSRYYNWTINKNRIKLSRMREEKKKILEDVMNTETYKAFKFYILPLLCILAHLLYRVAKEILDKYGGPDDQSKALKPFLPTQNVPGNSPRVTPATPGQLRQKQLALQNITPMKPFNMNLVPVTNTGTYKPLLRSDQLPRPLLGKDRSALDKVVDFLLKDGPNHRMALICTECFSHNGMAMMEEYEFFSYKCAYCGRVNPARKQRPAAPPLTPRLTSAPALGHHFAPRALAGSEEDSPEISSASDSEDEKKINNTSKTNGEPDRSPSPVEEETKSEQEKKED